MRILHEGQYELGADSLTRLYKLDEDLMEAVAAGDEFAFVARRDALIGLVRAEGQAGAGHGLRGSGPALPFTFDNPDFTSGSLRGTAVLRWEYRPGSTRGYITAPRWGEITSAP